MSPHYHYRHTILCLVTYSKVPYGAFNGRISEWDLGHFHRNFKCLIYLMLRKFSLIIVKLKKAWNEKENHRFSLILKSKSFNIYHLVACIHWRQSIKLSPEVLFRPCRTLAYTDYISIYVDFLLERIRKICV